MPRPRPRVHVVMPIGVGAPGTPVLRHLRASLDCLARQTFRDFRVTVAADENIAPEARSLVEAYGADIVWYPKDTYFRPGGIWKKITDQWQEVDSEYVAYFHYDDLWDETKLAEQVALIESRALNGCYTAGRASTTRAWSRPATSRCRRSTRPRRARTRARGRCTRCCCAATRSSARACSSTSRAGRRSSSSCSSSTC